MRNYFQFTAPNCALTLNTGCLVRRKPNRDREEER